MVPMNETLGVFGRQLCKPCATDEVARYPEGRVTAESITRYPDPTVCAQCGADNGQIDLPTIASVPVCDSCEGSFRNRPYPTWLKLSFAALVVLAVFCFVRNWRFIAAYREIQQVTRVLDRGDIERAALLSESAARHVPEDADLDGGANYFRGLVFLKNDKPADALKCFQNAGHSRAINGKELSEWTLIAEGAVAFDAKNYDEFLKKQKALVSLAPTSSVAVAGLASAYACKYAVTGSEEFRKQALKELDRAQRLAGALDPNFKEYAARIHHRLDTPNPHARGILAKISDRQSGRR
jgi:tetratricopeptide (TPR) repeat protein